LRNYTIIGVTGPTGAGKSTITNYFKQKGCYIIDADLLGKQAMEKGSLCLKQAGAVFGKDILNSDGTLNRQVLAKKAFSTAENTGLLNSITHPWICMQTIKRADEIRNSAENPVIVFDAAVLLESHMDIICDYVLAVVAPLQVRKSRIMKRDNLTEENANIRIKAQQQDLFYTTAADFVIDGSGQLEDIHSSVDNILAKITGGGLDYC